MYVFGQESYHRPKFICKISANLSVYAVCTVSSRVMHSMTCLLNTILLIFSLCVLPQVGGLSAPQKSRVGSLLPISTPTVAHGMIWSWAPLKLGKVSHFKHSCHCPPTYSHTHTQTTPHTLCYIPTHRYHFSPQFHCLWSVTKRSKLAPTSPLPAYANSWRRAGVNTSLCLPAIISMLEQSLDSGLGKQWHECQERPDHKVMCCTVMHCIVEIRRNITWYDLLGVSSWKRHVFPSALRNKPREYLMSHAL